MEQSRYESLVEAIINVLIGFGISICAQLIIFPLMGINIALIDNLVICACFTVISIVRSYLVRRFFNKHLIKIRRFILRG